LRDQEARRKAVMNAYLAAQKYCSTVECRRSTLLNYFGESLPNSNCGKFLFIFAKDSVELSEGPLYVAKQSESSR
jgi:superfamily II DNA helicase RecQ